jgi:hypothetical protein
VWQVSAIAGAVLTLVDPAGGDGPIGFDDQLNGKYLRKPDGTLTAITASSAAAQTVTVASAAGLVVGDLVQFRLDGTGKDLTYLDNPAGIAADGIKVGTFERSDIPATNNRLRNSVLRTWPGGAGSYPTGWSAVGAPTITKTVAAPFTRYGGQSAKLDTTADGQGIISDAVAITPTTLLPWISAFGFVWGVTGNVRVELVFATPGGTKVVPVSPNVASLSVLGQWDTPGLSGIDAKALGGGATSVQLRIVQNGVVASSFYFDGAQLTESAAQLPFTEGSGPTQLWQEANYALKTTTQPTVTYDVPLVDLEQLNPAVFGPDATIVLGALARINDPSMGIANVLTRIVQYERDYLKPGDTKVTLSSRYNDLTGDLARGARAPRTAPVDSGITGEAATAVERPSVIVDFDASGHPQITLYGGAGTVSMKAEVSTAGVPSDAAVEATSAIDATGVVLSYPGITVAPGAVLYVGAFDYSGASGSGTRSPRTDVAARRQGTASAQPPRAEIGLQAESQTSITHRVTGTLGAGDTGPLQYRYRYDTNGVTGTWSAYAALGSFADLVRAKNNFFPQELVVQVRDASATPVESDFAYAAIVGRFESHDTTSGRIAHGTPMDSGYTPFQYGSDTAAGVVETAGQSFTNGSMLDASRRVINVFRTATTEAVTNLFKRGSDSAADVVTTTSRTFVDPTTATQVDSSGRIVGVYRLGVIEPVNNLMKTGDAISDASLSANIPRKNTASTFTATNTFTIRQDFYGNNSFDYASAGIWLREYAAGGTGTEYGPRLGLHWGGVVASQIAIEWAGHGGITTGVTGRVAIINNPGTGYERLVAASYDLPSGPRLTDASSSYAGLLGGTAVTGCRFMLANGNTKGYVYGDVSGFGLLNDTGNWAVMCNYGSGLGGVLSGAWSVSGALSAASYTGGAVAGTNATFSNQIQGASLVITGASATVAGYPVARVRSGTATSVPGDLASGEVYFGY